MTALDAWFRRRGVIMFDIAPGVATPFKFSSAAAEHMATRRGGGLFDFSFMACVEIHGAQSLAFLHRLQTRNLTRLAPGRIAYTLMLRDDGTVLNDATVWCFEHNHYALFVGRRDDLTHVQQVARDFDVALTERSDDHAVLAVQGVHAWQLVEQCLTDLPQTLPYFGFWSASHQGAPCWIARLGYSGETGYEIVVRASQACTLWESLHDRGAAPGIAECGFEAINTLRIEAGHLLFSAELQHHVTPRELGLQRLVDAYATEFIGKRAFIAQRSGASAMKFTGLLIDRRGPAAAMCDMSSIIANYEASGVRITSACYSPIFQREIALAFVQEADAIPGTRMRLTSGCMATIARLPFFDPAKFLARQTK